MANIDLTSNKQNIKAINIDHIETCKKINYLERVWPVRHAFSEDSPLNS